MNTTTSKIILFFILGIINFLIIFPTFFSFASISILVLFFSIVPGYLLLSVIGFNISPNIKTLLFSLSLSITIIMLAGLFISLVFPLFGNSKPFTQLPTLLTLNLITGVLILFSRVKLQFRNNLKSIGKFNLVGVLFTFVAAILPFLTLMGVNLLDNNVTNLPILIMLAVVAIYTLMLVTFNKKIPNYVYPIAVFCISFSLLTMYSMRSTSVVGYDINTEYRIMRQTIEAGIWTNNLQQAYNSTLSVSILPVIYTIFAKAPSLFILKFLFQVIFSFVPVGIYLLLKNYTSNILAYLGAFFFISQFQFMQQMPALARQEIAFLFFIALLLSIFDKNKSEKKNIILQSLLAVSLVLSHYSTAYITITLFLVTVFITRMYNIINKLLFKQRFPKVKINISNIVLVVLIFTTYLWYGLFTRTLSYLTDTTEQTIIELQNQTSTKSEQAKLFLGDNIETLTQTSLDKSLTANMNHSRKNIKWISYYPLSLIEKYPVYIAYSDIIPFVNVQISDINNKIILTIKLLIKIFNILGVIYLSYVFIKRKLSTNIDGEVIVMSAILSVIILGSVILPYISAAYNLERLYQQALFILVLPIIIGAYITFKRLGEKLSYLLISAILVFNFLFNTGFIPQLIGGIVTLNLNNSGEDYSRFYTHKSEIYSARWLDMNVNEKDIVQTDEYGALRLRAHTDIDKVIISNVTPGTLDKYGYVYGYFSNLVENKARSRYNERPLLYAFPNNFLKENKNIIYSNSFSQVYK